MATKLVTRTTYEVFDDHLAGVVAGWNGPVHALCRAKRLCLIRHQ